LDALGSVTNCSPKPQNPRTPDNLEYKKVWLNINF